MRTQIQCSGGNVEGPLTIARGLRSAILSGVDGGSFMFENDVMDDDVQKISTIGAKLSRCVPRGVTSKILVFPSLQHYTSVAH